MTKTQKLTIWGRDFTLPVEYDCYDDETVTQGQIESLSNLAAHPDWIEEAKRQVEIFCSSHVREDAENNKKDNIFSYVKPEYLFVKRDESHPKIALMCRYRYDIEHGLTIVFSFDGIISVGIQDIIL